MNEMQKTIAKETFEAIQNLKKISRSESEVETIRVKDASLLIKRILDRSMKLKGLVYDINFDSGSITIESIIQKLNEIIEDEKQY